jgi:NAD(P)-dependent dehydrogenase (short-subunit alcohol dehydrogenase family)
MSTTLSHQVQGRKLLDKKVAVVYGANGGVGSSVAKAFAREGATVFLAARTEPALNPIIQEISSRGGVAYASKVDALNPNEVEQHLQDVLKKTGRLDVSFNLAGMNYAIGSKLVDISDQQFMDAAFKWVRSRFITMTAAARIMEKQGHGVILALTAPNARLPRRNMGGFAVGGAAIEAMCRQLALEAGPRGVRVVCLRTGSTPDNPIFQEVFAHLAKVQGTTFEKIAEYEAQVTALKRNPLTTEVANAAVMIASDYGSAITATVVNASNGELVD